MLIVAAISRSIHTIKIPHECLDASRVVLGAGIKYFFFSQYKVHHSIRSAQNEGEFDDIQHAEGMFDRRQITSSDKESATIGKRIRDNIADEIAKKSVKRPKVNWHKK